MAFVATRRVAREEIMSLVAYAATQLRASWSDEAARTLADWCETHRLDALARDLREGPSISARVGIHMLCQLIGCDEPVSIESFEIWTREDHRRSA